MERVGEILKQALAGPLSLSAEDARTLATYVEDLKGERDTLRSWDNHFRAFCGFKRDGRPSPECLEEYLEKMIPEDTLDDALKLDAGPFQLSKSGNGTKNWFNARDASSGVSIPGKSREDAKALVTSINRACINYAKRQLQNVLDKK
ncbi:hypothetical protein [Sulfitobacter sp. R18_1]|uniref:hypothetical protein n=1 Tax=Sulfitobacter sp. R18_1 TaxID=2821104 RepID=UPI001ADAED32|nr:hypothetical protein [Sulfitobacter sp. R18_1]MBO9428229.1 hypothetical protein [Sulfitobacter sp. R18_1]